MRDTPQLVYWDSCVFTAFFSEEPERVETLAEFLENVSASNGRMKIITSTVTKVETSFVSSERELRYLFEDTEKRLDDFWADDSIVELVELNNEITKLARQFIRASVQKGWKTIKPMDAIHLATARWLSVFEFHTYNTRDFEPHQVDFRICQPYVTQKMLPQLREVPSKK